MRRFIHAFILGLLASAPVCAQIQPDTVVVLSEIEVVDSVRGAIRRSGVASRLLSAERISAWSGTSVSDLLAAESFASVRRYGPSGLSTVSLRGSGSQHTLITLDGVALTDPQTGRIDLSTVPLTFLESAVVSLGAGHKSAGQGALGGTVELRSLEPTNRPFVRGTFITGAYGRQQGGAAISRSIGPLKTLVAFDLSKYEGDFPYQDPSSFPPRSVRRTDAEQTAQNVFGRVALETSLGDWDASVWASNIHRGVPGPSNAPPIAAKQNDRATRVRVSNAHRIKSGSVTLRFAFSEIFLDYLPADGPNAKVHQRSSTRSTSFIATVKRAVSSFLMFEAESSIRSEKSTIRFGERQSSGTLSLQGVSDHRKIQMSLGGSLAAWNDGSNSHLQVLPRASIRLVPTASEYLTARVSAGRIFRPPTFSDRFWLPGGNPDLLPETGWSADAGLDINSSHDLGTAGFTASIFWSSLNDKIIWHPSYFGGGIQIWTPDNIGQVIGYGGETSFDLVLGVGEYSRVEAVLLYSFSRNEDRTDPITRSFGKQLRYAPQHEVKARLSFAAGSMIVEAIVDLVSKRHTSSDERFSLPGYRTLSFLLKYSFDAVGGKLALQMAIENLENANVEHIRFYPMPPRHLSLSLRYTIHKSSQSAS